MEYTVNIQPWSPYEEIPYSEELADAIYPPHDFYGGNNKPL